MLRFLYFFTTYTFILSWIVVLFHSVLSVIVIDIVRALAMTTAIGMFFIYIWYGHRTVLSFYRKHKVFSTLSDTQVYMLDTLLHFVPVILLGFAESPYSGLIAICTLLVWYSIVRKWIGSLYIQHIQYDQIVSATCISLLMYSIYRWHQRKHKKEVVFRKNTLTI